MKNLNEKTNLSARSFLERSRQNRNDRRNEVKRKVLIGSHCHSAPPPVFGGHVGIGPCFGSMDITGKASLIFKDFSFVVTFNMKSEHGDLPSFIVLPLDEGILPFAFSKFELKVEACGVSCRSVVAYFDCVGRTIYVRSAPIFAAISKKLDDDAHAY